MHVWHISIEDVSHLLLHRPLHLRGGAKRRLHQVDGLGRCLVYTWCTCGDCCLTQHFPSRCPNKVWVCVGLPPPLLHKCKSVCVCVTCSQLSGSSSLARLGCWGWGWSGAPPGGREGWLQMRASWKRLPTEWFECFIFRCWGVHSPPPHTRWGYFNCIMIYFNDYWLRIRIKNLYSNVERYW